ncbi:MATE family efflux transporter [Clostridium kluyveri]|uniref:Predicted efflux pump n=2 Tax=Clostridium kluyveri TaxID=1534 RepID=A5MZF8_CLOK5|nr:MATE family efflux transporter [Clostridium kluyveri]EDK34254.1 Predicted efflux pump [Clostridium kluyveri DSM 555]
MGADDKSFLNDKVNKLLFRFAVPAIFSLLVGEFYNIIAIVFAGRYIGTNAIGALTVEFPIQRFFIALGLLIAVGTSTYAARIIGKKDISELKK